MGRETKGEKMRERRGWRVLRRGLKTGERIFFRTTMCNRVLQEDTIPWRRIDARLEKRDDNR